MMIFQGFFEMKFFVFLGGLGVLAVKIAFVFVYC
jgi:hypothetical protein